MMIDSKYSCFICGNYIHSLEFKISEFKLLKCKICRLISLTPQTSKLNGDYSKVMDINSYISYMKPLREKQYNEELKQIKKLTSKKYLLDIGSALGWFLKAAYSHGFVADGVEPQKDLAILARNNNKNSHIYISSLEKLSIKNRYDIVTLWSVIEHFKIPNNAVKKVYNLLNSNGVIAIRTPNGKSLATRVGFLLYKISRGKIRTPVYATLQMEFDSKHWFLFTPHNLKLLLEKKGFKVIKSYFSTSVDYKNLDTWLASRNIKQNYFKTLLMKLFFLFNQLITPFGWGDDFVVIAQKIK